MTNPAQPAESFLASKLVKAAQASGYTVNSELAATISEAARNILDAQIVGMGLVVDIPSRLPDEALFQRFVQVLGAERLVRSGQVSDYLEELCDDIILYDPGGYSADDDDEDDEE